MLTLNIHPVYIYDHRQGYKGTILQRVAWGLNVLICCVGVFFTIGGLYASIKAIIDAYASGAIGKAFDCNGNTA